MKDEMGLECFYNSKTWYTLYMNQEEMLKRILELTEENTRKINSLYRAHIWSTVRTVIYWMLIIGIGIGAFYFIQPFVDRIVGVVQVVNGSATGTSTAGAGWELLKMLVK